MRWVGAEELRAAVGYRAAVDALADALREPGTAAGTPPRQVVDTAAGQLLLMPAEIGRYAGVKVVGVAPANPARGLPRVQGGYLLFDAATLTPLAGFDAAALTTLRTAAVSALAVSHLAGPDASRLTVFGAGPQALAHIEALALVCPLRTVAAVARTPAAAERVAASARRSGLQARAAGPDAVADADIVACCTTARAPLFDPDRLGAETTVVAVGSHEPDVRELPAELVRRATVVVETRRSAATAGDLVLAATPDRGVDALIAGELADLVAGRVTPEPGRPRVFKSVGEAWEDLVIGAAAYDALGAGA